MRPTSAVYLPLSLPTPSSAGVVVPHRGMVLSMHDPAGGSGYVGGLGFFDAIAGAVGSIVGGIFGSNSEKRQLKAQQAIANAQLNAQLEIARLQSGSQDRAIDAAVSTARIQAENELAAINAAYNAQLTGQRLQKAVAEEQLSAQLLAQTQSGIFSIANQSLVQTGNVATAFPRAGVAGQTVIIGVTVLALAWAFRPKSEPKRKRTRFSKSGKGGRYSGYQSYGPAYVGSAA